MAKYSRRELLKCLMAGGVVTAAGLWMPGQKLISIPSGKVFVGVDLANEYGINSMFRLIDRNTVEYIGAEDKVVSINQFYEWLQKNAAHMLGRGYDPDSLIVSLEGESRMINPEHLINGSLSQTASSYHCPDRRELWTCTTSLGHSDLFTDKVYYTDQAPPRTRISSLDNGHRGLR